MKALALALALASLGCQTLSGTSDGSFADDTEFRSWFAFYYLHPDPERLTAAVRFMDGHGYLENFPDISSAFIAEIAKAHPEQLTQWAGEWDHLGPRVWNVAVVSFWLAHSDTSLTLARRGLVKVDPKHRDRFVAMLSRDPREVDLLSRQARDPRQINMLWAAFSATGDVRFVNRIIGHVRQYGDQKDPDAALVGEAAIMTLATNALQHTLVAEACKAANSKDPDPRTRTLLSAMLKALAEIEREEGEGSKPAH